MPATRAFFRSTAAALALGASLGCRPGPGLPGQADHADCAVLGRRRRRCDRAAAHRQARRAAQAAGGDRERRRRGRHHRHAEGRRASPADGYTLLFAVASPLNVAPLVAPSAVRYDTFKDFVPVATVGTSPFVLIGKTALPATHHGRTHPAREGAAGQAQLRHRRRRHLAAHHGRDVQAARRHRHRARALQVGPAGADRRGRRPGRPGGAAADAGAALHQGRQGQGLRRDLAGALAQRAGDSCAGRDAGTQGTGDGFVARRAGPGRHAGRRDRGLGRARSTPRSRIRRSHASSATSRSSRS